MCRPFARKFLSFSFLLVALSINAFAQNKKPDLPKPSPTPLTTTANEVSREIILRPILPLPTAEPSPSIVLSTIEITSLAV